VTNERAEIGIFGGSGFYSFLDDAHEVEIETPYGAPSAPLTLGSIGGRSVAFLPRHGKQHQFPPHMINYRANLWAMRDCGVNRIVGPCAVGSLRADVHPGEFLIADQLVDRTNARKDTFYKETGIALVANATKLAAISEKASEASPYSDTPLHYALEAFLNNANEVGTAVEDFLATFSNSDAKAIEKHLATLKMMPAATYKDGYEATVMALKANEAVLKGSKIKLEKAWFSLG
jgi:purine nucleoside phosphorylase